MLRGLRGLTATLVSFWPWPRPKNPAALWLVHSWLARTLVPPSGQPPLPVAEGPGTEATSAVAAVAAWARACAASAREASGSAVWTPEGPNRLILGLLGAPPAGSSDAPTTRASTRLAMKPIDRALPVPRRRIPFLPVCPALDPLGSRAVYAPAVKIRVLTRRAVRALSPRTSRTPPPRSSRPRGGPGAAA